MADVAADKNVPIILMHNRTNMNYTSLMDDIKADLEESIDLVLEAGVQRENIILDPGIGFAKDGEHNLVVMHHLEKIVQMNFPVLLGSSRKRFIGSILDVPAEERDVGTGDRKSTRLNSSHVASS